MLNSEKIMLALNNVRSEYIAEPMLMRSTVGMHKTGRRVLLAAAVVTLMLALMGAALYMFWSRTAELRYRPTQEEKKHAQQSGLSVMLETNTEEDSALFASCNGIKVSAVQTLADKYGAEVIFKIEGFELPQGRAPWTWLDIELDGKNSGLSKMEWSFFDGIIQNEQGEWVYLKDGSAAVPGVYDYTLPDGSMELRVVMKFAEASSVSTGRDIVFNFAGFGLDSEQKLGSPEMISEGEWTLHWTLTGADGEDAILKIMPEYRFNDHAVTLTELELGQKSIKAVFRLDEFRDGYKSQEKFQPVLGGVQMKDGRIISFAPTAEGYIDEDDLLYYVNSEALDGIVDINEAEAVLFIRNIERNADGTYTRDYEIVPIEQPHIS